MDTYLNLNRKCFFKAFSGRLLLVIFFASHFHALAQKEDDGLKIFMLCDMEGSSGIFTKDQAWYWEDGVPKQIADKARELMTLDVNAAAAAALDAGVDELIICDTHHGGNNIIPEHLLSDPRITFLERSVGVEHGKRRWMPGLDETVDGFILLGHHAKAGTEGSFLPHTQTLSWADFRINGQSVGEIGLEACYAGHWNIPLILVQGDEATCKEAEEQFPGVITAEVKLSESYERAVGLDPKAARELTAVKVTEAINKLRKGGSFTIFKTSLPMTVRVEMTSADAAEKAAQRPGVHRVDQKTVEGRVAQQAEVIKWITGAGLDMRE